LNNAHERADRLSGRIIGREAWEAERALNQRDHELLKHDITVIQTRSLTFASVWGIAAVVASLALSVIFHLLR
jgi:hypothetical protein